MIKKHYIGNVLWKDFESIIHEYINDYNNKFKYFTLKIDFQLSDDKHNISIDNIEGEIPLYRFKNSGWISYKFCQSRKVHDYVIYISSLKNEKLEPTSIINNVILTIFLTYKTMKRNYLLLQPRSVLESKLMKQILFYFKKI